MMVNNYLNYQVIGCSAKNLWENGEEIMRKDNCLRNISNPDDSDADTEKSRHLRYSRIQFLHRRILS